MIKKMCRSSAENGIFYFSFGYCMYRLLLFLFVYKILHIPLFKLFLDCFSFLHFKRCLFPHIHTQIWTHNHITRKNWLCTVLTDTGHIKCISAREKESKWRQCVAHTLAHTHTCRFAFSLIFLCGIYFHSSAAATDLPYRTNTQMATDYVNIYQYLDTYDQTIQKKSNTASYVHISRIIVSFLFFFFWLVVCVCGFCVHEYADHETKENFLNAKKNHTPTKRNYTRNNSLSFYFFREAQNSHGLSFFGRIYFILQSICYSLSFSFKSFNLSLANHYFAFIFFLSTEIIIIFF